MVKKVIVYKKGLGLGFDGNIRVCNLRQLQVLDVWFLPAFFSHKLIITHPAVSPINF